MKQSEFESLMMAHDNLQRELADIKQRIGKDKHALIKSNIALNRKMRDLEKQNKRFKEVIEEMFESMGIVDKQKYGNRLEKALEGEE